MWAMLRGMRGGHVTAVTNEQSTGLPILVLPSPLGTVRMGLCLGKAPYQCKHMPDSRVMFNKMFSTDFVLKKQFSLFREFDKECPGIYFSLALWAHRAKSKIVTLS